MLDENFKNLKDAGPHRVISEAKMSSDWAYLCLELICDKPTSSSLDMLTAHSYIIAALTQLHGLTGAATSFDILKMQDNTCWVRVAKDDLSKTQAAITSWNGIASPHGRETWSLHGVHSWLSVLVAQEEQKVWND
ncbi:Bgt-981 [Blumeria graminis f. sp. tritici]|uniref:Ribonucleases P/MRP subunit Pop8-like domain-containing protein n=3 Tax=Blumeria graminis f. sp. tritici TaxID=62690 RepID=A0A656KJJ1_BLUGR|nr:hypothetical protein BGT96224_981 [Blumeria graminis f. sp. tritici 96224]VCU40129.1 Bgt-981 [Blumeria graminis f. sp. tritici]